MWLERKVQGNGAVIENEMGSGSDYACLFKARCNREPLRHSEQRNAVLQKDRLLLIAFENRV